MRKKRTCIDPGIDKEIKWFHKILIAFRKENFDGV